MTVYKTLLKLCPVALALLAPAVQAAYTCTTTSPPLYVSYLGNQLDRTGQITITCTRTSVINDLAINTYSVGFREGAGRKYVRIGGNASNAADVINYDIFRESSYSTNWNITNRRVSGTINFGTALTTSFTLPYYLRIPFQLGKSAGSYAEENQEVNVQIPENNSSPRAGVDFIQLYAVISPVCSLSPPANINLNYVAFSSNAVSANTNFTLFCTNKAQYDLALSATSGTLVGINYTLALSATSAVGSGLAQTYSITATALAGQAGICSSAPCSGTSSPITLTISY